jgi:hypothetical protein
MRRESAIQMAEWLICMDQDSVVWICNVLSSSGILSLQETGGMNDG